MLYEVFIPSVEADGFDESITVDAENWMAALKSGLERTGEGSDIMRNLMCDIKDDNSIHVTDAVSRRVFVLRELEDDAESAADGGEEVETVMTPAVNADAAEAKAAEEAKRAAEAKAAEDAKRAAEAKAAEDAKRAAEAKAAEEAKRASEQKAAEEARLAAEAKAAEVAKRVAEAKAAEEAKRAAEAKAAEEAKRAAEAKAAEEAKLAAEAKAAKEAKLAAEQKAAEEQADKHIYEAEDKRIRIGSATHSALKKSDKPAARVVSESRTKSDVNRTVDFGRADEKVSESLIEDIFLEIQDIHEGDKSMQEVIDFVMDMAMEKIGAESGSVLFADVNGQELYFAAARGPKAADIMDFRVPMGMGIVGFCTREGVSLAISDAENDPRFYKEISESLGYDTHGLLCAPIQHEGRVYGAIEVMNKKASGGFSADETNALAYIGRQLAQYVHGEIMRNEKIS